MTDLPVFFLVMKQRLDWATGTRSTVYYGYGAWTPDMGAAMKMSDTQASETARLNNASRVPA